LIYRCDLEKYVLNLPSKNKRYNKTKIKKMKIKQLYAIWYATQQKDK